MQPSGWVVWGDGRDANEHLIDRLSALVRALDPVPPGVRAGASAAFLAAGDRGERGAPDVDAD